MSLRHVFVLRLQLESLLLKFLFLQVLLGHLFLYQCISVSSGVGSREVERLDLGCLKDARLSRKHVEGGLGHDGGPFKAILGSIFLVS